MRISEITYKNLVWKNLLGMSLAFEDEFSVAEKYATAVLNARHISRYPIALSLIQGFTVRANEFLNAKPFDPADPDLIALQQQVRGMIRRLAELEHRLTYINGCPKAGTCVEGKENE